MTPRAMIVLTAEGIDKLKEAAEQVAKYLTEEPYTTENQQRFRKCQGTIEIDNLGLVTSFYRPMKTKEPQWILHVYALDKKGLTVKVHSALAAQGTELGDLIFRTVEAALKAKVGLPPLTWA